MKRRGWTVRAVSLGLLLSVWSIAASAAFPQSRATLSTDSTAWPAGTGAELRVFLVTMGPGREVWERFGHNAILIDDPAADPDTAYNYGLFDFRQENFLLRFIRGQMWYWMAGFPAGSHLQAYIRDNRSVWLQELNLAPRARLELREFLRWNERPENRFYHYDYYRDNCSTRVRDAIDRAVSGTIRAQTDTIAAGTTYRFHTQRLTANDPLIFTGLLLALGPRVDRPITAWEEMFLPLAMREHLRRVQVPGPGGTPVPLVASEGTLFESTAPVPPARPPTWLPWYLLLGLGVGALAYRLASAARDGRGPRIALGLLAVGWGLLAGLGGLVLAGLWAFTDHVMAYGNENLFQLNPLALGLAILVPAALAGSPRAARWSALLALGLASLSLTGFLVQAAPGLDQVNGPIVALALPVHVGLWLGLRKEAVDGMGDRLAS